ncbi:hypothetical protein FN846DRAFT_675847 [Sphaerosporella brunnea]|uniref:General transcription factor TFIIB n=1 Tax=Sphaerosporella brunnea TaxID=1250544 RepID=A0A5J5FAT7_9PEZI|nr:hypothetical protein FN846DRAFT_675847 [Sphaerosporella brunnea]
MGHLEGKNPLEQDLRCPECLEDPPNVVEDFKSGDILCRSCGLVTQSGLVDMRAEWRTFEGDAETGRVDPTRAGKGYNELLKGEQLSTLIGGGGKNKALSSEGVSLSRLQTKVSVDSINLRLQEGFARIEALCATAGVSQIVQEAAKHVLSQTKQAGMGGGLDAGWCLACIYHGAKRVGMEIDKRTITRIGGNVPMKAWTRHIFDMNRLNWQEGEKQRQKLIEQGKTEEQAARLTNTLSGAARVTPRSLMVRFCQAVGVPIWVESIAAQICDTIDDTLLLGGRAASNIATVGIYIASHVVGLPMQFDAVFPLSGLSKATMRNATKKCFDSRVEMLKNHYWPKDPRVKDELFEQIMDKKYFASPLKPSPPPDPVLSTGVKRKASDPEDAKPKKVAKKSEKELELSEGKEKFVGIGLHRLPQTPTIKIGNLIFPAAVKNEA